MPTNDDSAPYPPPEEVQYELRVERVVRGREARTKTKIQNEGWEFVSQSQGVSLRRELTFRRAKRPPMTQGRKKLILAGVGALVVLVIIGGIAAALLGGDDTSDSVALDTDSSATPSETASPEPTSTPTPSPEPTETPIPYIYAGPEYEVVTVDPRVGLGRVDQYWVLTDTFDYSTDDYKEEVKLIISDLARKEGTASLIVNVVSDAEIIEAESAATMMQFANEKGPDYFTNGIAPKEESDWAAAYTGGINYNTGKLSESDAAFQVVWRPYATSELEGFKPTVE